MEFWPLDMNGKAQSVVLMIKLLEGTKMHLMILLSVELYYGNVYNTQHIYALLCLHNIIGSTHAF